ncbi:MAG: 3-hydroxyacyl-CoA dehydrogenase NAD-binding domain-containing protein [Halofilum sp. (in: g-proteobacteria)]|nr:3-hydroxyacyl-CoA dehydrogenase NAD-binding domain-containing protein [Halofilum sp. (in: g-proteobacteria)]
MSRAKPRHLNIEVDEDNLAWLTLDVADAGANTLSGEVLDELDAAFERFESERPQGVVIRSAKPGFIAGANVSELGRLESAAEAAALIERGQALMDRIAAFGNTVALIRGHCLGGGLELALACRYRIADRDPGTRLGLPEVKLGIHPGFGGSVRLPDQVGPLAALDLMLSGRTIDGRAARAIGLVDQALAPWQLERAARHLLLQGPAPSRPAWWKRALALGPARAVLRPIMERQLRGRVSRDHYPAPYALLELWVRHGGESAQRRTRAERDSLVELVEGPTANNLIRVFLLQDRLKREARDTELAVPRRVHVIGAGTMGGDIAAWFALHGCRVTLADERPEAIASTLKRARSLFQRRLKRPERVTEALDRLIPDANGQGVPTADLVLEAIVEDLAAKKALFAELEPRLRDDAVLATNTSSLPLERLAEDLQQPGRLVGLHFFNPVAKMPLVEVVAGDNSDDAALARGQALVAGADKLPLRVKSGPGFLVNRLLMPYMLLAARRHAEGTDRESIDAAARRFGMPMGPLELADSVGLDICIAAAEVMAEAQGLEIPQAMRKRVEDGDLGRKSGRGFYTYKKGKPDRGRPRLDGPALAELGGELLEPLLDEAERCRDEGVVADADLVDAGAIFGCGFAPFTGGPLHYRAQATGRTTEDQATADAEETANERE